METYEQKVICMLFNKVNRYKMKNYNFVSEFFSILKYIFRFPYGAFSVTIIDFVQDRKVPM